MRAWVLMDAATPLGIYETASAAIAAKEMTLESKKHKPPKEQFAVRLVMFEVNEFPRHLVKPFKPPKR